MKRWPLKPKRLLPRARNHRTQLASSVGANLGKSLFARCNFEGRSKLAAQLILLHFVMNLPKKVSLVSAYTFYMYEAMDIACNDYKDDTNVGKLVKTGASNAT